MKRVLPNGLCLLAEVRETELKFIESCFGSRGSGWIEPEPERKPPLESITYKVPWVVVGAGFSGIAAARQLATRFPDQSIFLFDAMPIAGGNAGRSSGFVVSLGTFDPRQIQENKILYHLGMAGITELRQLIQKHNISCQWTDEGRLICARSYPAQKKLEDIKLVLNTVGSKYKEVHQDEVYELTGMNDIRGIKQLDSALVHPSPLVRGLVESLPENVSVVPNTQVRILSKDKPIVLRCGQAEVHAENIITTVNGFTPALGMLKQRVFPVRIFASLAKPNPENAFQSQRLWGSTTAGEIGSSLRLLSCGRILIRNGARFGFPSNGQEELNAVAEQHWHLLRNRFPNVIDWQIESTWSAPIGITANSKFFFGRIRTGIFGIAGHNGHGIAAGTSLGKLIAEYAAGEVSSEIRDVKSLGKPTWIPGQFLTKFGVDSYIQYLRFQYRKEM